MMTLLRGLHSIAAQRGDGLRPELLRMMPPSPAWSGVERMSEATEGVDRKPADDLRIQTAEVVAMPRKKPA